MDLFCTRSGGVLGGAVRSDTNSGKEEKQTSSLPPWKMDLTLGKIKINEINKRAASTYSVRGRKKGKRKRKTSYSAK